MSWNYINCRCLINGKVYGVNLKLFGSINPEMTDVSVKTFYILVIIQKLCLMKWPRLSHDNSKRGWIKRDTDSYEDDEVSEEDDNLVNGN